MTSSPATSGLGDPRQWLGLGLVLTATLAWALQLVLAAVIYGEGSNPITLLAVRALGFVTCLYLVMRLTGQAVRMPRRERHASLGLGLMVAAQSYAYYSSIEHIPVSLAVLIFYTSPILVALAMRVLEGEPLTPLKLGALAAAFLGLALTFQVQIDRLAPIGIGLATFAAFALATTIVVSSRILRRADSRQMTLHMTAVSSTAYLVALAASQGLALPGTAIGWLGLAAMPLLYLVSMLSFFTAVPLVGATRAAMFANAEPVYTLLLAALLLGEPLTALKALGAAFVIGAIVAMQLARIRAAPGDGRR